MSLPAPHERYELDILAELETNAAVSQRSLARRLGIALGLTNLIVRQLVRRGWVRMVQVKPNRVKYLLTRTGVAEKARMTRDYLAHTVRFYAEARDRISQRLSILSAGWPAAHGNGDQPSKRVVFYGANEVAEIGFVCLQSTDLALVGVVDEVRAARFFGLDVERRDALRPGRLGEKPFDVLIVMSFGDRLPVRRELEAVNYPVAGVFWM